MTASTRRPGFVLRWKDQYWGRDAVTGQPGWTWSPAAATRYATEGHARHDAALQETFPGDFTVVSEPCGSDFHLPLD